MTGGRLKRVRITFTMRPFVSHGDGVADVDISALITHHLAHGRMATVTAVQPPGRYGSLQFGENSLCPAFKKSLRVMEAGSMVVSLF